MKINKTPQPYTNPTLFKQLNGFSMDFLMFWLQKKNKLTSSAGVAEKFRLSLVPNTSPYKGFPASSTGGLPHPPVPNK